MSDSAKAQSADVKKPFQDLKDSKGSITPSGPAAMATIEDDDERLLARLGYRQVLVDFT
jgi:hypothetical protein